jgi:chromosome partitioning protein
MTRIIAIVNQKGGVGKTTTAVNLAASLATAEHRTLLVDSDPQGNATSGVGVPREQISSSIYDSMIGERELRDVIVQHPSLPFLDVVPATQDLVGAEVELVDRPKRETILRNALNGQVSDYEFVLIDCPPSLGLITLNVLAASHSVLIPIQCEYYALEGVGQLLRNIEMVKAHLNPELDVTTVVLTMYDGRTKLADQVATDVRAHFGDKVLRTVIPRSVKISEAPGYGMTIIDYDRGSRGAMSYLDASREVAQRGVEGQSR